MAGNAQTRLQKAKQIEKIYQLLGQFKQIILCKFENVGSNQIQMIRKSLRSYNSHLLVAKNTLIKKVIKMRTEGITEDEFKHFEKKYGGQVPSLKILSEKLTGKIALIFSDAPVYELKTKIESNRIPSEAKIGAIAPVDFAVPAGPTGLDPSQINFFHALNISTKIVKGQIQITKDFKVTTSGKKVKASEAALLKKLDLKPFSYGMTVSCVYDDGAILPQAVLNIDPASLFAKFEIGVRNIVGLSLSSGIPTAATIPLVIGNAFRNIAALSLESGFKIKELDLLGSSAPAPAPAKEEKKEEKPAKVQKAPAKPAAPEPKQEEEMDGMGGLFD